MKIAVEKVCFSTAILFSKEHAMTIVTISRQMGSLGSQIAYQLAEVLGYRLVWRELINIAARRSGFPEMALAEIDELGLLDISPSPKACRAYREAVDQIVAELADEGRVVLLGRAGQVILARCPDALHVRVVAPPALRAERVASRLNISPECAAAQVEASDKHRTQYLRRFYHVRWDDPMLYHLVLNTAFVEPGPAITLIQAAMSCLLPHAPGSQPGTPSPATPQASKQQP